MSTVTDEQINMLLCFMNDQIEEKGRRPSAVHFDFNAEVGQDLVRFQQKSGLSTDDIRRVINTSYARHLIEHPGCGGGAIFALTPAGQGCAVSLERAKHYVAKADHPSVTIGTINGPAQIGNHNTQTVDVVFTYIASAIDKSPASTEEKEEAKSLWRKALAHPVTSAIIGAGAAAIFGAAIGK